MNVPHNQLNTSAVSGILPELVTTAVLVCFRYEVVEPPDGMYGDKQSGGEWTGLMGMLMREVEK